jgi:5'-3' exonuclease
MGVRGLMTICKSIKKDALPVKGQRIGIDAFSLIFLFREKRAEFQAYLQGLAANGNSSTFVMDKRAQKEKKEVVDGRKEVRAEAKTEATEITSFTQTDEYEGLDPQQRKILEKYLELKRRDAWCLYPEYVKWMKDMVTGLGIPILMAKEEADTVLARGEYDIVISSDSDLLILGCKTLWIPSAHQNTEIRHDDFMRLVGLSQEQLYQMAYLAGCDVQPKKHFNIEVAIDLLKRHGSLENIPDLDKSHLEAFKVLKESVWTY